MCKLITVPTKYIDFPHMLGKSFDLNDNPTLRSFCGCDLIRQWCVASHKEAVYVFSDCNLTQKILSCVSDEVNKICLGSQHCGPIISKFLDKSYTFETGYNREISVWLKAENHYVAVEGKHRVCMAKRFGVETLDVVIK